MTATVTSALILAGGLSRRMGEDKTQLLLCGTPLIDHVVTRIAPQVETVLINAPENYAAARGLVRIPDIRTGHLGPLAGILSGLRYLQARQFPVTHLLTCPADTPFVPTDLVTRLLPTAPNDAIIVAASYGRRHPLTALWPLSLADDLDQWLQSPDNRRVLDFVDRHPNSAVAFETPTMGDEPIDPFFNINRPEDFAHAERYLDAQQKGLR